MNYNDLENLLEQSKNKLDIFTNEQIMKTSFLIPIQIIDLVDTFLNDSEKLQLFNYSYFQNSTSEIKIGILGSISNKEVLTDKSLILDKLHLDSYNICNLAKQLSVEDIKRKIWKIYNLQDYQKLDIATTFSYNSKVNMIINQPNLHKYGKIKLLTSFNSDELIDFLSRNKEVFNKNNISPYQVVSSLSNNEQLHFIENLENANLTLNEKREILVTLSPSLKAKIDTTNFPKEYKNALSINTTGYDKTITLDLERNLEDYSGLDKLLKVNPENFSKEQKDKFLKLCEICPNQKIVNSLELSEVCGSSAKDYKEAEEWISSLINSIPPSYSNAQKIAIIDNAIGKKISYVPDFETEVFDGETCRSLWKIINSGYGICDGIAKVEQYILNKVEIESEMVSGEGHAFLKLINIELPLANGETIKGNTILDPTWNLSNHRFGAKPNNFCINYEQARKNDVDKNGKDYNCHNNDKDLKDATLSLDEESLRKLFASVGLTDKDEQFPIRKLIETSNNLNALYKNQPEQNVINQFKLLAQTCPEFSTCINPTTSILSKILLNHQNLNFNECVVNRVYNKSDEEKRPVLFVYINSNELGEKFYFANKNICQFVELPKDEFTKHFECYEEDKKRNNGLKFWEITNNEKENINLSNSSGNISIKEGDER